MKLVIQTDATSTPPLQNAGAVAYLEEVHAFECSPSLEMGQIRYHYLQIDDSTNIDWLIPKLMEVPGIEAAFPKPDDQPAL